MMKPFSRRHFLKAGAATVGALATAGLFPKAAPLLAAPEQKSQVFFTRDLSPGGMRKLYALVNEGISGKTALKLHTGEPNGPNIIPREWVSAFMEDVPQATIVECNVLYGSPRRTTEGHRQVLETNGWTFCPVDIMDASGDANLPVQGGKWIQQLAVGQSLTNYDSMVVLTHFKGHSMGGFGGSLKNISIGCASGQVGKAQLHREGNQQWAGGANFMERMVEGGKAITDHFGPRITYVNVLRNMSVDCDCAGIGAAPVTTPDIGILASTDILAIDQASIDMVYALPETDRQDLVERIESRSGLRQLTYMQEMGMGNSAYELITVS